MNCVAPWKTIFVCDDWSVSVHDEWNVINVSCKITDERGNRLADFSCDQDSFKLHLPTWRPFLSPETFEFLQKWIRLQAMR